MQLTSDEVALIREALVIPTCWNPRKRDAAVVILDEAVNRQLSLLA